MTSFDPIRLGLVWRRLNGMIDEASETFIRTSFSSVVRENYDMAFSLLDRHGRLFIQARHSIPSFIGTLPRTLKAMLEKYPTQTLKPGDVLIANDSWIATGHLNDITMVYPIFRNGRLIAYAGSTAHTVDIGGAPRPDARDSYEEGLTIPICKIIEEGRENPLVIDFLEANLREPAETLGDIRAQYAGYRAVDEKLFALLDDEKLADIDAIADEILDRSERSMRETIAAIPDGEYVDEMLTDGMDEPLTLRCSIRIKGSELAVDFAGTSPQQANAFNVVMNYTLAYGRYALKCALDPAAPNNDGSYRPIGITAPEGSVLNARRPAAVWARHLTGHYVPASIYGALSKALPDKVIAEAGSPLWNVYFKGLHPETGKPFVKMFFMNGGHGALPDADGPGCLSFPSNAANQPIELFENQAPVLVTEKAFVTDTAGPGRYRGGPAQRLSFRSVSNGPVHFTIRHERVKHPPRGLHGGGNGAPGRDLLNGRPIPPKMIGTMQPGDTVTFQTPGGGGMGPPTERDPARVAADLKAGVITPDFARRHYGVKGAAE